MIEHSRDLVTLLLWLTGVLGSLGLATVVWGIKAALGRMDQQDNKLEEIRALLQSELGELRDLHHSLDVRVTKIESTCAVVMGGGNHGFGRD